MSVTADSTCFLEPKLRPSASNKVAARVEVPGPGSSTAKVFGLDSPIMLYLYLSPTLSDLHPVGFLVTIGDQSLPVRPPLRPPTRRSTRLRNRYALDRIEDHSWGGFEEDQLDRDKTCLAAYHVRNDKGLERRVFSRGISLDTGRNLRHNKDKETLGSRNRNDSRKL